MKEIKDVIITGYSNVTKEGVVLHLNKKARLREGNISCTKFWISWDKIGEALIEGYTKKCEVSEHRELRFFDIKGQEITDGCVIWNPANKHPEQSVKLIDGELWFGAKGTTPNKNNDWCKLDKRYGTEKYWLIVS